MQLISFSEDSLPDRTRIFQVDDGTIFYHFYGSTQRLYVKSHGKYAYSNLPESGIFKCGVFGNAIFFSTNMNEKIYRSAYTAREGITISLVRKCEKDEDEGGLSSRWNNENKYVYRMCDEPYRDAILVDTSISALRDAKLKGVHLYCRDCSPFLYVLGNGYLYTINIDTMEFLPDLGIEQTTEAPHRTPEPASRSRFFIQPDYHWTVNGLGVHDGVITLSGRKGKYFYEMAAQLPLGYVFHSIFSVLFEDTSSNKEVQKLVERINELEAAETQWVAERAALRLRMVKMEDMMREGKVGATQPTKPFLEFERVEKLSKPLVCIQLENGTPQHADLTPLEGEFDCAFIGTIGNHAYFRSVRGKVVKFFRATIDNGMIDFEQINAMKTTEISLFNNQPLYFLELSREWSVYQYHENLYEVEGEKFDISEINHLSKYDRQYHRGVVYLFRENTTATVERVNENVVKVEGPLLDVTSYYAPSHSAYIYILNCNRNVILILNTTNLAVTQIAYEPLIESDNHSIVGIHNVVLTMAFDGILGRHVSTTIMP